MTNEGVQRTPDRNNPGGSFRGKIPIWDVIEPILIGEFTDTGLHHSTVGHRKLSLSRLISLTF